MRACVLCCVVLCCSVVRKERIGENKQNNINSQKCPQNVSTKSVHQQCHEKCRAPVATARRATAHRQRPTAALVRRARAHKQCATVAHTRRARGQDQQPAHTARASVGCLEEKGAGISGIAVAGGDSDRAAGRGVGVATGEEEVTALATVGG